MFRLPIPLFDDIGATAVAQLQLSSRCSTIWIMLSTCPYCWIHALCGQRIVYRFQTMISLSKLAVLIGFQGLVDDMIHRYQQYGVDRYDKLFTQSLFSYYHVN